MILIACACLALAALPALMIVINLRRFRRLPAAADGPPVSVLIPARNEQANIARSVTAILASIDVDFEVIVLDDHSIDATASIVAELAATNARLRLEFAPPLPLNWNGKQHACAILAKHAKHDLLLFTDADVVLAPDALARMASAMSASSVDLLSGFPRELTGGWCDSLVIPLIYFMLLGYLPLWQMRRSNDARFAAGCGQLFIARHAAYESCGGHAGISSSRHDGLKLPRLFRQAGYRTDVFDASDLAQCRMYGSAGETWQGLLKNADEGMATPIGIWIWTVLLAGGSVAPWLIFLTRPRAASWLLAAFALALPIVSRMLLAVRFRQSFVSALFHPIGVTLLLLIQWQSMAMQLVGKRTVWRGRG